MSEYFVAEIRIFAGNFAPKGWAMCNGQIMPISQNTALFSLLGTTYGGDGKSTFALPDLQGMAPMHSGQGQGLSERFLGETGGSQYVTLLESEMPVHTHVLGGSNLGPDDNDPAADKVLTDSVGGGIYSTAASPQTQLGAQAISVAGSSLPHNNMPPYLVLNFIIALQGIFPPRG